jgi:hypothetical protein
MARIDITLEDGMVVADIMKEGIEANLMERNPKL